MFKIVTGLLWLVVLLRFILPLPWPWALKVVLALVLLIASQYHYFSLALVRLGVFARVSQAVGHCVQRVVWHYSAAGSVYAGDRCGFARCPGAHR